MVAARLRFFLLRVLAFGRIGIVVMALLAMANAGPAPGEVSHDVDRLVAASHQQPAGTCHQSSHQCPVAVEAADFWHLRIVLAREDRSRPNGDPTPDEFLEPSDTPPPRV